MKYYRLPVTGIDERIQRLQDELHDILPEKYGIPDTEYQCFARIHKTPVEQGFRPEAYMSDGNYHEVLLDDRFAVQSFFGTGDSSKPDKTDKVTQVHLVFFVHLGKITSNVSYGDVRADVEAREIVESIMGQNLFDWTWEETVTSVQAAMQGYVVGRFTANQTQVQAKAGLKLADMHPFHIFRLNGTIRHQKPLL